MFKKIIKSDEIVTTNSNVVYVFIDASNLWQAQKAKGRFLNYEEVTKYIKERFNGTDGYTIKL